MKRKWTNPFELDGKWYKANLHTHSTVSDGSVSPEDRVEQYRKAGYDILALTDHRTTNDVQPFKDKKILVISGMEYHPLCPTTPYEYHLVGLNLPHGFTFTDLQDALRCIAEVRKAGGETILAHPFWTGQAYEDFKILEDLAAMEVYNSTCDTAGRPASENEWAHGLDRGFRLPIVASDDAHHLDEDVRLAWTWLKMPALTTANVLAAIRNGACYASCGPKIHEFAVIDQEIRLRCSPVVKIQFVGPPGRGATREAETGTHIAAFNILHPDWTYIRAVVTDETGRKAWSNPVWLQ